MKGAPLISAFSVCVGVALAELFLPTFNGFADKSLALKYGPGTIARLVAIALGVTLLAGIHPAVTLSGFSPISVLKHAPVFGGAGPFTRTLLVTQFGFAVAFIVGAILMDKQIDAVQSHALGFDSEQLVNIRNHHRGSGRQGSWQSFERFRNLVESNPDIISMTGSYGASVS